MNLVICGDEVSQGLKNYYNMHIGSLFSLIFDLNNDYVLNMNNLGGNQETWAADWFTIIL